MEDGLRTELARVLAELAGLAAEGDFKARQVERLRVELDEYRADFLRKLTVPLLLGIVKLHDDVSKRVDIVGATAPAELPREKLAAWFRDVVDDIELMLRHHGVEAFHCPGERFDRERQLVVCVRPAPEPGAVGTVQRRLRPGFVRGEEILQKERVEVYGPDSTGE
jgi:molecular chaperone GrpE (heat shock protein)